MPFIVSLESSLSLDWLRDGKALETVQCTVKQSEDTKKGFVARVIKKSFKGIPQKIRQVKRKRK